MDQPFPKAKRDETIAAYRLAGQAVIAWLSGVVIRYVRLGPNASEKVVVELPPIGDPITVSDEVALDAMHIVLAGLITVGAYRFGCTNGTQAVNFLNVMPVLDREAYEEATRLATYVSKGHPENVVQVWSNVQTICCMPRHWSAIETLAETLLLDRELAGCEIDEIVCHALRVYQPPHALAGAAPLPQHPISKEPQI